MCSDSTSMTRPCAVEALVELADLGLPVAAGHVEDVLQPVAGQLVGGEREEVRRVEPGDVAQPGAEHPGRLVRGARRAARPRRRTPASPAAAGRAAAAPPFATGFALIRRVAARRRTRSSSVDRAAVVVEQLLGPVGPQPRLEDARGARRCRAPAAAGPGAPGTCPRPAGRRRPAGRSSPSACAARSSASAGRTCRRPSRALARRRWISAIRSRQRSSAAAIAWWTVDRVVAGHDVRVVAVAAHQRRAAPPRGCGRAASGWRSCTR